LVAICNVTVPFRNHLPSAASIIVVDMQNGFVHPDGSVARLGTDLVDRSAATGVNNLTYRDGS